MVRRSSRNAAVSIAVAALLSACASPHFDRSAANFDETAYHDDLAECRGGSATTFMMNGVAGAIVGSALGAFEGAKTGITGGSSAEGALIGSAVGGVIGVSIGALWRLRRMNLRVRNNPGMVKPGIDQNSRFRIIPTL